MDVTVVISGVSACGAFIAAVASVAAVLKANELHLTMNSRLDQLLLVSTGTCLGVALAIVFLSSISSGREVS